MRAYRAALKGSRFCYRAARAESGSALIEFMAVGILLLVPIMWLTVSILHIESTKLATDLAARNAARALAKITYSKADEDTQRKLADRYIHYAFEDQGITTSKTKIHIDIRCLPHGNCGAGSQSVQVKITAPVEFINIPSPFGTLKQNLNVQSIATFPKEKY